MTHSPHQSRATLHLHLWLTALHRTLADAVEQRRAKVNRLGKSPAPTGAISPGHATQLLDTLSNSLTHGPTALPPVALTKKESRAADRMRAEAEMPLPLDLLETAGFSAFDRTALLILTAPEVLPEFRPLYGFVLDDMARTDACVDLVLALTHSGTATDLGLRLQRLGPGGPLRRLRVLTADDPLGTHGHTRLSPTPGLLDWLLGTRAAPPVPLRDTRMIWPSANTPALDALDPAVRCLKSNANGLAGLWGTDPNRHDDAIASLASAIGRPVLKSIAGGGTLETWWPTLAVEAATAAGSDALLWIDARDVPTGGDGMRAAEHLAALTQRIVLTGRHPWRPSQLVGSRAYADVYLPELPITGDWGLPDEMLSHDDAMTLDTRYRLGFRARRAARQVALSDVRNRTNGSVPNLAEALQNAARKVATPAQMPSLQIVEPRRTLKDLILPDGHHDQIAEMGALMAHTATVDDTWGFGRLTGSRGALKALFTGDPGTGKTLAAEVAAGVAGVSLMKVDLSQVVSKWVGETEKNLEAVFDHAEQSRAALFFDEADALFGKRGEVRHGTDRYANLEVSYLLQRLESYSGGLLILASNLRDEIDPAFTRRFQISLHFPRPQRDERRRIWEMAFAAAPLSPGLDLNEVAEHDLTGGGIVSSARMAALLAAGDGAKFITRHHIERATERQFRKEARLMASQHASDSLSIARGRA